MSLTSPYLTTKEATEYLRLGSTRALRWMIAEHHLPFCRLGRHYRFDTRELDAWLRGHGSAIERSRVERKRA
jgi:excisionase family DNA binding protein